jgi:hypothetical protein
MTAPPQNDTSVVCSRHTKPNVVHGENLRTRTLISIAATSLAGVALLVPANSIAAIPPAGQQLTLAAWDNTNHTTWQKKNWRRSRAWCLSSVGTDPLGGHVLRWQQGLGKSVCGTTVKSKKLDVGQTYNVTVSGLVSYWRGTWPNTCGHPIPSVDGLRGDFLASADPSFTFATKRRALKCASKTKLNDHPSKGGGFLVNADGGAPLSWGPAAITETAASPTHTYSFTVTGTGKPAYFALRDYWVSDNYGSFTIAITPASPVGT